MFFSFPLLLCDLVGELLVLGFHVRFRCLKLPLLHLGQLLLVFLQFGLERLGSLYPVQLGLGDVFDLLVELLERGRLALLAFNILLELGGGAHALELGLRYLALLYILDFLLYLLVQLLKPHLVCPH